MVGDGHVHFGCVTAGFEGLAGLGVDVGGQVESCAGCDGDVLVFRCVVDTVLPDKLQATIILITLEHPHRPFRQRYPQPHILRVPKLNLILCLDVLYT
jgi:hypothetical protein